MMTMPGDNEVLWRPSWILMNGRFLHGFMFRRSIKEVIVNTSIACRMAERAILQLHQYIFDDNKNLRTE